MAYFCYRQYFPPLHSKLSHRPYEPRYTLRAPRAEEAHEPLRRDTEASRRGRTESYSDHTDEQVEEELRGTVPRQGAQDLSATWQHGQGKKPSVQESTGQRTSSDSTS
jgi:hypothetical protein